MHTPNPSNAPAPNTALTATERSISARLAFIFALRMFGLFIVLPILAPYALTLPFDNTHSASHTTWAIGLAMGAYGLTQALLYIPYGIASDRWGRKPIITIGLIIFILGSIWAATAHTQTQLILARALQGMGAISSVIVALVADSTRPEVRTRAMAMIGMSIAFTFAVSLILAPLLFGLIGMSGIFLLIGGLAVIALPIIWTLPPTTTPHPHLSAHHSLGIVLKDRALWQLNAGVFILHAVQMAMWVVIPSQLIAHNLTHNDSALLYLIVILLSMGLMVPLIIRAEKYHRMFQIMRAAIGLILIAQVLMTQHLPSWAIGGALLLFFTGFNVLEATQPSALSKITHPATKGAASGVYNTVQALGLFAGAMLGAWLNTHWGATGVFIGTTALTLAWLLNHQFNARHTPTQPSHTT